MNCILIQHQKCHVEPLLSASQIQVSNVKCSKLELAELMPQDCEIHLPPSACAEAGRDGGCCPAASWAEGVTGCFLLRVYLCDSSI